MQKSKTKKKTKATPALLTEEEMIFGFGTKPTDEQLEDFFTRPDVKGIPVKEAFVQLRATLKKRREDRNAKS